jgi:hypothetical protein
LDARDPERILLLDGKRESVTGTTMVLILVRTRTLLAPWSRTSMVVS